MKRRTIVISVLAGAALVAAMAYGSSRASRLDTPDADEAAGMAETMLRAFDDDDYEAFSASFGEKLREDLDREAFEAWRAPLADAVGGFIAVEGQEPPHETSTLAVRYTFDAAFERDEHVRFVFVVSPGSAEVKRVEMQPDA